ncbi:methionine--tRNA ligase [Candidatus Woesearchaeota archaeon]|nr:methionine--tRNA ligase [Candidatus Woesearchaeota archaeon]
MTKFKKKKFYITTAIAYPNSAPHLGHALEIVHSDIAARFHRLLGKDVHFQTGTDEHGLKNWQSAQKQGKEILEFLDHNVSIFKDLYGKLDISYDYFVRTSDKKIHYPGVIKLWKELVKSGDLYKKNYRGLYCTGCEAFKTEKELKGGKCPNHPNKDIETVEEENYFFRLSKYREGIAGKIKSDEFKVIPEIRKNEVLSFLKIAEDISFSRPKSSLPWGIPVPDDESQIMYVWCDALSNYITGAGYGRDEKQFKELWPADIEIIGKDILRFHAAFWPAMLISAKIPLPRQLFVHGFILSKGAKMGKSTGNVIEPFEQIEKFGVEPFRFYLAGVMPLGSDGEYSEELLIERVNKELVANLSNFCYRTLSFLNKNFNGEIKGIDDDKIIIDEITKKIKDIGVHYENYNLNIALNEILAISAIGNKYFQDSEPWKLIKEDKDKAHKILGLSLNIVKNLSILIEPILPEFSSKLQKQLNLSNLKWKDIDFKLKNHKIGKGEILVKNIELKETINKNPIKKKSIDEKIKKIFPLNLKVAEITDIQNHPNADKLYVLQIDLGNEKRQLVAGLREDYAIEELKNKKIIVITNLKHAKLRGVESQGMLLAGEDGEHVGVLTVDKSEAGEKVYLEGYENSAKELDYDEFAKLTIMVKNNHAVFQGKELKTDKEIVHVEKVKDGKVK